MNDRIDPVFYGFICAALLWLATLWLVMRFRTRECSRGLKAAFGVATVLMLFVPIAGLPLWNWAFSFCPNPSLPMLGVVCAALWLHLCRVTVFKPADWRAIWLFGAIAGTALYLHPLLIPAVDLYYWGWHHQIAAWALAAAALVSLAVGNRLGVLFLAALVAYDLGALESNNGWDYVVDPFYWMVSLVMIGARVTRATKGWFRRRTHGGTQGGRDANIPECMQTPGQTAALPASLSS